MRKYLISVVAAVAAAAVYPAVPVLADDIVPADQANDKDVLEVIIVTATRRDVRLQDVPQSLSVLTSQKIQDMGAINLEDYALSIPSLQITKTTPGNNNVSMRGIRSLGGQTGAAVGYYLDETPISAAFLFPEIPVFDVERVEVLRGPQGTLYGEGSVGGTIRVITKKPNVEHYEAEFSGTLSTTRFSGDVNHQVNIMANAPLIKDRLAIRLVAGYGESAGFIDNVFLGIEDVNTSKNHYARIAAQWLATDNLTITASANTSDWDWGGRSISNNDLLVARTIEESGDDEYELYNLTIEYGFSWADFLSSTSYYERDRFFTDDVAFALPFLGFVYGLAGVAPPQEAFREFPDRTELFTEEARLVSTGDGPLQWTAGFFYKNIDRLSELDGRSRPILSAEAIGIATQLVFGVPGIDVVFHEEEDFHLEQIAGFGEVTYKFSDRFDLLGGLRLAHENRKADSFATGLFLVALAGSPPVADSSSDSATVVTPKGTLTYHFKDDGLIYATISSGFRSGGQNAEAIFVDPTATSFGPEKLWNYEFGVKSVFADGLVTFNAAAFYMDWKDLQAVSNALTLGAVIDNVGSAHSLGVDGEIFLRPFTGMQFTLGGAWTEAEIDVDVEVPVPGLPPAIAPDGTRVPGVPKFTFNAAMDYRFPAFNNHTAFLHADFVHYGSNFSSLLNAAGAPGTISNSSYDILNLRVGIEGEHWQAAAFVRNLTDDRVLPAFAGADVLAGLGTFFFVGRPRTIGVDLRLRW